MSCLLVENKKTAFVAVIPSKPTLCERQAAKELCEIFYRVTGIDLLCVDDESEQARLAKCTFQIGQTEKTKKLDVDFSSGGAGESGYIVKTIDDTVYICGYGDAGTVFGVYGFMSAQFGYEAYSFDEIYYGKLEGNEQLKVLDVKDIPDFPYRQGFGKYFHRTETAHKLKCNTYDEAFIRDSHQPWHNTFRIVPPEIYNNPDKPETYHPKWYLESGKQLHILAHGDEKELAALRDLVFEKMTGYIDESFKKGKYCQLIGFMQEDKVDWADDDSMKPYKEKYGEAAPAASLIHFLNPIAKRIKAYMKEKYDGRPMYLVTFAYWQTIEAPVVMKDGEYVPIDDSVKLEDNFSIFYAPLYAEYTLPFTDEKNKKFKDILDKWHSLTKNISLWTYSTYFRRYFLFYDNFGAMQDNLRFFKKYNPYYVFNESNWNFGNLSFNSLKEYVMSKLMWNTEENMDALFEGFFKNYYKDVWESMFKMFTDIRNYQAKIAKEKNFPLGVFGYAFEKEYWPLEVLDEFLGKIDAMYKQIKPLSITEPYKYQLLVKRIKSEGLMYRYLKQHFYPESYGGEPELRAAREEFREDCEVLSIRCAAAGEPLTVTLNSWGYTFA